MGDCGDQVMGTGGNTLSAAADMTECGMTGGLVTGR